MKVMTCQQLGGACDLQFRAKTFEEMAELSKNHGMEMFKASDANHIRAMDVMMEKMNNPETMQQWIDQKREEFHALPETYE